MKTITIKAYKVFMIENKELNKVNLNRLKKHEKDIKSFILDL